MMEEPNVLWMSKYQSPIGEMILVASDTGLCLLEFGDRPRLSLELEELKRINNALIYTGQNPHILEAIEELEEYFQGKRRTFNVNLDAPGTAFQKKVWNGLLQIPYGITRSYEKQAALLENPKAIRAIASANGQNRISIIIPCHRVIGKDGNLRGYGGGLGRKKWLLDHEAKYMGNLLDFGQ